MNKEFSCNPYEGGTVPPCSAYLNNIDPIIKNGRLIYRNENRLYFFISTTRTRNPEVSRDLPETTSPATETPFVSTNLQISMPTFLVGLFINQIQLGIINYNERCCIHHNKTADDFVHQMLKMNPEVNVDYVPKIAAILSNSNAILPLYTYAANITPLNYYILFILNRLEMNPGLFFGNNTFVTEDPINFTLASLDLQFPLY